ncbi:MAG: HlyC/CorC family transporter [Candidatus Nealsonbacteria bacterium]|nr:HlyC/CorC family transporter [Candidatus Nealsonbacteria bacterium]
MMKFRTILGTVLLGGLLLAGLLLTATARASDLDGPLPETRELGHQPINLVMMIVYATVALVFSFLCSVAEAVVLSVSPSFIANLEKEGKKSARLLGKIKADVDRSLAAILTLNTIAHTVGAGGAGAEAAAYFGDAYVGIAMGVLTLLILFLSEIIPKTLGALYWRRLAPSTARFVQWLIWGLYPLILVSERLTTWLTGGKKAHRFSREEFTALADIGGETGDLDDKELRILQNLFRFPSLCAEDIMTPRTVMFALQQDMTVHEVMQAEPELCFSRIPIYGNDTDDVAGFVLKTDVLLSQHRNEGKTRLRDMKRELRAVHEATRLSLVFEELLDNRAHVLLVVDEYGGTEGIVTLEDVVETLIGIEIVDEADQIDDMRRLARQKWHERMERLGIDVREGEEG